MPRGADGGGAKYPGPFFFKISILPSLYLAWKGTRHLVFDELHKKYGEAVRTEPNFLSLITPNAIRHMYGPQTKFQKACEYPSTIRMPATDGTLQVMYYTRGPIEKQVLVNIASTSTITLPTTPSNSTSLLGPDMNVYSGSDDFDMDFYSELFDATMLPTAVEQKDPSPAASLADNSLGILTMASDCNFPNLTAHDQASLDDPCPMFPAAGATVSKARSNTSIGAISLPPTKNSPLSIQSLQPSLQDIQNNAHLRRAHIPVDEAMRTNKVCMSQISRTMENEESLKSNSCSLLVATAMQMVILLYEKALSTSDQGHSCSVKDDSNLCGGTMLTRSPHSTMSSTLTTTNNNSSESDNDQQHALSSFSTSPSRSRMPDLQFGVFQFEPEEQTWIRNHIIRKELQRCIQTLRACHSDEHQSRQQSAPTGGPPDLAGGDGAARKCVDCLFTRWPG
ncbi:hypothetical protein EPUS_09020 [Endocarpon pusillum Z07020]|uniref:Uncharacterized protein n=1 Tax=Endocarpon pusillum (strain Z07020 / HMAS-L-300199) TaxID=1263415 RepID=U1GB96_ENDPU|nr:uncharacterized protein EPUS_09020 [Endocarpon pusillum Z07020]ERF68966.1 hypothetical protein EPUS_09020 [Endocarpon pusillum Z07020]